MNTEEENLKHALHDAAGNIGGPRWVEADVVARAHSARLRRRTATSVMALLVVGAFAGGAASLVDGHQNMSETEMVPAMPHDRDKDGANPTDGPIPNIPNGCGSVFQGISGSGSANLGSANLRLTSATIKGDLAERSVLIQVSIKSDADVGVTVPVPSAVNARILDPSGRVVAAPKNVLGSLASISKALRAERESTVSASVNTCEGVDLRTADGLVLQISLPLYQEKPEAQTQPQQSAILVGELPISLP